MKKFLPVFTFFSLLLILSGKSPLDSLSLSPQQVGEEAAALDRILGNAHREHKLEIPDDLDDGQLVRRIYLSIAGRIPSYAETTAFLKDGSKNKKAKLIDYLLKSPAYDSQMFNWWADLLRLQTRMRGGNQIGAGEIYNHWVRERINENTPFDQVAYSLITAEGYPWEDGATGYYLRDAGMELDNMSNTTQLFLGTQMVCAQCHNHPFDKWTQQEYYKMAAFTYGVTTRMGGSLQNDLKSHFAKMNKGLSTKKKKQKAQSKEGAALRKALQEAKDELAASHVELARINGLFEESQRLLAARDLSLAEAMKNVEFLTAEEKRLQVELGKSEHMRMHHEGNHAAAESGKSELEEELQKLRESLVETNMRLNHSDIALEELKGKHDDAMNRSKEMETECRGLREELNGSQHDNELLRRDLSRTQGELDQFTKLYKDSEESMGLSRQKVLDLESALDTTR